MRINPRILASLAAVALGIHPTAGIAGQDGAVDLFGCNDVSFSCLDFDPSDTDFDRCSGSTSPFGTGHGFYITVYVYAQLSGLTANGIRGAEFYVQGFEEIDASGWVLSNIIPENGVLVGSIFSPIEGIGRRAQVGFPDTCVAGTEVAGSRVVFLGGILADGFNELDIPTNTYVSVVAGDPPSDPTFNCPLLLLCDDPVFTKVCVTGGQFIINSSGRDCTDGRREEELECGEGSLSKLSKKPEIQIHAVGAA